MITGDNHETAQAVAGELGLDDVRAEVVPGNKAQEIKGLQSEGRIVAMAGDGINNAPASGSSACRHRDEYRNGCRDRERGHEALLGGDLRGIVKMANSSLPVIFVTA